MKRRNKQLGEELRRLDVPEHGEDFFTRLEEQTGIDFDAPSETQPGKDRGNGPARRPFWRQRAPRSASVTRPVLLGGGRGGSAVLPRPLLAGGAAVILAAVVLAVVMFAPGGLLPGQVVDRPMATATEVKAKLATALQQAAALTGILVVVAPDEAGGTSEMRWEFAATAEGDFRLEGENRLGNGEVRSEALAYDASTGIERSYSAEEEGIFAGERRGLATGLPDPAPSEWVLDRHLGSVVRALIAADDPGVREDTLDGRAVWVLDTEVQPNLISEVASDRMEVTVDQETGFPVRVVETAAGRLVQEFRLENLQIDPALGDQTFILDFPGGAQQPEPVDHGFRRVELEQAAGRVGYAPLVPGWLPGGFSLTAVAVAEESQPTGKEGMNPVSRGVVSSVYRSGFDRIVITTRLAGDDPSAWSDPLASGEGYIDRPEQLTLGAGVLTGGAAEVLIDPRSTPHLWALGENLVLTISGDVSRDELVRIAESLAPLR